MSFSPIADANEINGAFAEVLRTLDGLTVSTNGYTRQIEIPLYVGSLSNATNLRDRSFAFTAPDDMAVTLVMARGDATGGGLTLRARLEVDDGDGFYLSDEEIVAEVTSGGAGVVDTRNGSGGIYNDVSRVVNLVRGVRYRFSVESSGVKFNNVHAALVLWPRLRSFDLQPGVDIVPWKFENGQILDVERLNDNAEAIVRAIRRNQEHRYFDSFVVVPLDGVTNASATVVRQVPLRRSADARAFEVIGIEAVIYTSVATTWRVRSSIALVPTIEVKTTADATKESYASLGSGFVVPSAAADATLTLECDDASTITRGYLILHIRTDRWQQGIGRANVAPLLLTSLDPTDAADLEAWLEDASEAALSHASNDFVSRPQVFVIRNVAAGNSVTFRIPAAAGLHGVAVRAYNVAAVGCNLNVLIGATGSVSVPGAGATVRATAQDSTFTDSFNENPTDPASDVTLTMSVSGAGSCVLGIAVVWWK
jgi:hypothetical protein